MASSKFILRAEALLLMRAGAKAAALTREARTAMNLNMAAELTIVSTAGEESIFGILTPLASTARNPQQLYRTALCLRRRMLVILR